MAGGAFFAPSGGDEEEQSGGHAVQWVGKPAVKGPKWAKMPLLTVGMLGIQCVWSIEMGYASPYLLELGLSKSWMSLVFMAGPLSGLIVQPLIGIFADRSKSRWGRRRPFMLAGVAICATGMMSLGWAKQIGDSLGSTSGYIGIGVAVWSIYLIDFSINAVMSTDRALVVDTLTPSQQEEGSAWAGRMFGFGSVVGFFVGNLNLVPYLSFLGGTQIQILSFLTSLILVMTHTFTSWAVTERVLLRDDRPQSKSGFISNLRAIWQNMFTLSPSIQQVCIIQFFAFLGWFPILFFTTVWVSEIYKVSIPLPDGGDIKDWEADAVRCGARALFFQSLVNIVTSIGVPFLVGESGIHPSEEMAEYAAINGNGNGGGMGDEMFTRRAPGSATRKRSREVMEDLSRSRRIWAWMINLVESIREDGITLPIKGLTLVRMWWISQFMFAACMAATWFVSTIYGAYVVISLTGFCWGLAQWAPYSLLGELILIEGTEHPTQLNIIQTRPSDEDLQLRDLHHSPTPRSIPVLGGPSSSNGGSPLHSRHTSSTSLEMMQDKTSKIGEGSRPTSASGGKYRDYEQSTPVPSFIPFTSRPDHSRTSSVMTTDTDLTIQNDRYHTPSRGISPKPLSNGNKTKSKTKIKLNIREETDDSAETSLVLQHSDEDDDENFMTMRGSSPALSHPRTSPISPRSSDPEGAAGTAAGGGNNTADKAGVILGIHNVYLVLPQFIVTFLASIIFYLLEPEKKLPDTHPGAPPPLGDVPAGTGTPSGVGEADIGIIDGMKRLVGRAIVEVVLRKREGVGMEGSSPDAVGLIFRIGGVAAVVGGCICLRLARRWARGEGL